MGKFTSSEVYNKCLGLAPISDELLEKDKAILLMILKDIAKTCENHHLHYVLGGGSLLGAIRHKGFIPWDDDIDINMPRQDANKLKEKLIEDYGDKYFFVDTQSKGNDPIKFLKVMLSGTTEVEIAFESLTTKRGLGIDIFYIDNIPDSALQRKIRGLIYSFSSKASSVCFDFRYPSKSILDKCKTNSELRKYYNLRRTLGFFFSILPMKTWIKIAEKCANYNNNQSKCVSVPSGNNSYNGEIQQRKLFDEYIYVPFEDAKFRAPKDYDTYLKSLYGNYMQVPPPEKRLKHMIYILDLGKYEK